MKSRSDFAPSVLAFPKVLPLVMLLAAVVAAAPAPPAAADVQAGSLPESDTSGDGDAASEDAAGQDAEAASDEMTGSETYVDEVTGELYRIEQIPKVAGTYLWHDEKTIRTAYGVTFEVVDEDEDWFWVKLYEGARKERPQPKKSETEEEALARIADSYRTDLETTDRLHLREFGVGLPRSGQWRQGFDIADMNGDGHLDIVFGPARKARSAHPNIFLGDGQGSWRLWREARFPPFAYDYGDAAAGDLNGDGHMDLVMGAHLRGLLALVGDGEGGFSAWTEGIQFDGPGGRPQGAFSSRAVELVDWNGDGRLDILAFGEGPRRQTPRSREDHGAIVGDVRGLAVYVNQGDGTWSPQRPTDGDRMDSQFGDDFALADVNRDGRTDIVLASRVRNSANILGLGTEEGLWAPRRISLEVVRRRALLGAVELADHDGDGTADLFVGYQSFERDQVWRTGIDLYTPDEELEWRHRPLYSIEGREAVYGLDVGDLDGDGHLDVAAATGHGNVWILLGDGEGSFVREESPELPPPAPGCRGYAVRLHDLDGDGGDEVVVGFAGEPGGLPGVEGLSEPGCPGEGSLRAWKAVAAGTGEVASAARAETGD